MMESDEMFQELQQELKGLLHHFKGNGRAVAHTRSFLRARPKIQTTELTLPLDQLQTEVEKRLSLAKQTMARIRSASHTKGTDREFFKNFQFNMIQFSWFVAANIEDIERFMESHTISPTIRNAIDTMEPFLANFLQKRGLSALAPENVTTVATSSQVTADDGGDATYMEGEGRDPARRQRERAEVSFIFLYILALRHQLTTHCSGPGTRRQSLSSHEQHPAPGVSYLAACHQQNGQESGQYQGHHHKIPVDERGRQARFRADNRPEFRRARSLRPII